MSDGVRWSREDVQRVLYYVVCAYEQANSYAYTEVAGNKHIKRRARRRRAPFLGGDSELLRDAIRIARETLKDNDWWPTQGE